MHPVLIHVGLDGLVDDWTGGAAYISTDKQSPVLDNMMQIVELILIKTNLSVFVICIYKWLELDTPPYGPVLLIIIRTTQKQNKNIC